MWLLSSEPKVWGRNAVDVILSIWKNLQNVFMIFEVKLVPWSEWITRGEPNQEMNSSASAYAIEIEFTEGRWFSLIIFSRSSLGGKRISPEQMHICKPEPAKCWRNICSIDVHDISSRSFLFFEIYIADIFNIPIACLSRESDPEIIFKKGLSLDLFFIATLKIYFPPVAKTVTWPNGRFCSFRSSASSNLLSISSLLTGEFKTQSVETKFTTCDFPILILSLL